MNFNGLADFSRCRRIQDTAFRLRCLCRRIQDTDRCSGTGRKAFSAPYAPDRRRRSLHRFFFCSRRISFAVAGCAFYIFVNTDFFLHPKAASSKSIVIAFCRSLPFIGAFLLAPPPPKPPPPPNILPKISKISSNPPKPPAPAPPKPAFGSTPRMTEPVVFALLSGSDRTL